MQSDSITVRKNALSSGATFSQRRKMSAQANPAIASAASGTCTRLSALTLILPFCCRAPISFWNSCGTRSAKVWRVGSLLATLTSVWKEMSCSIVSATAAVACMSG
jgi:hypothetical protein